MRVFSLHGCTSLSLKATGAAPSQTFRPAATLLLFFLISGPRSPDPPGRGLRRQDLPREEGERTSFAAGRRPVFNFRDHQEEFCLCEKKENAINL